MGSCFTSISLNNLSNDKEIIECSLASQKEEEENILRVGNESTDSLKLSLPPYSNDASIISWANVNYQQ